MEKLKAIKTHGKIAYNIDWDTDGDEETAESLPQEIFIPDGITQPPEDYITDLTGFCHFGFEMRDADVDVVPNGKPGDLISVSVTGKTGSEEKTVRDSFAKNETRRVVSAKKKPHPKADCRMIVIIGESGSGKTTVQKELEKSGVKKVVTYTTRPMRCGETDGVDYHFVSEERFAEMVENGDFAEHASYRGWNYGTAIADCGKRNTVAAVTPAGMRQLKKALGKKKLGFTSVYLKVDRRTRLISILERGDDIEEAYRRSLSDVGQFDGVENEVDFVILNGNHKVSPEDIAFAILKVSAGE